MHRFLFIFLMRALIAIFTISSVITIADEAAMGQQAEQARKFREALSHYIAALQPTPDGSDAEQRLQEKIIMLVQKIQPPPTVPEEVLKYEGRAEAAIKNAKKSEDYLDAAKEYQKAIRIAPWVASYYFNLGIVLEKGGKMEEAIKNLKLYLLAAPNAQDARDVKKKIAGLEYEIEKGKSEIKKIPEPVSSDFGGIWRRQHGDGYTDYRIEVQGKNITVTFLENFWNRYGKDKTRWVDRPNDFQGTVTGDRLIGTWANSKHVINSCPSPTRQEPIQGYLKPKAKEIEISFEYMLWDHNTCKYVRKIEGKEIWRRIE
jgi:tetratricopeptide (TPR) repeat protein